MDGRSWARLDPLWAIASTPDARHGRWDAEEFYAVGERKVRKLVRRLDALGVPETCGRSRRPVVPARRGDQSMLAGERFDLVYSGLVLQHLPSPAAALGCWERLCAAVGPGGVLVTQSPVWLPPSRRIQLGQRLYKLLRRAGVPPRRSIAARASIR